MTRVENRLVAVRHNLLTVAVVTMSWRHFAKMVEFQTRGNAVAQIYIESHRQWCSKRSHSDSVAMISTSRRWRRLRLVCLGDLDTVSPFERV